MVQFEHALRLAPDLARAHAGYGYTLTLLGRLKEGIESYREAVRLKPDYRRAWNNLAGAYMKTGEVGLALGCYQHDYERPEFDSHLFALNYQFGRTPAEVFAAHLEWGRRIRERTSGNHHRNPRTPGRKLRIGYVSGDFRDHAVATFFENVLRSHDYDSFEVVCYDNSEQSDEVTKRLQRFASGWRTITGLSDAKADALIRSDRIDILIDLSGHTGGHRLEVFARRPAPVQATYLGYPNTTGLAAMGYRITDATADPPGLTDAFYTENLVRLPRCFLAYRAPSEAPEIGPLPVRTNGYVTFGSFSSPTKWNDAVLRTWARILQSTPASRLLLHHSQAGTKSGIVYDALSTRILGLFQSCGITSARVRLIGRLSEREHLNLYNETDLALDPFPYNGTTATLEALWMGVPVITLVGATHVSRVGVTLLRSAGLERFAAQSADDYVKIASELASNPRSLVRLRSGMRERLKQSPLLDARGLARSLEDAYRWMWQRWCVSGAGPLVRVGRRPGVAGHKQRWPPH